MLIISPPTFRHVVTLSNSLEHGHN